MNTVGLIPARKNSMRVRGKNTRLVNGKPLIVYTLEDCIKCDTLTKVYVSTDDWSIIELAHKHGIPSILRPSRLAANDTPMIDVVKHFVSHVPCDIVVLLQPTSPLRTYQDIDAAVRLFVNSHAQTLIGVRKRLRPLSWTYKIVDNKVVKAFDDNIDGDYYEPDGYIFIVRASHVLAGGGFLSDNTIPFVVPEERAIDIDTEFELRMASALMAQA